MEQSSNPGFFADLISSFYINTGGSFSGGQAQFGAVLGTILGILNYLTVIILGLAVIYFLWGVFKYVATDSDTARSEAVQTITHGIIILFVMVSLWSLVAVIGRTFGLGYNGAPRNSNINVNRLIR